MRDRSLTYGEEVVPQDRHNLSTRCIDFWMNSNWLVRILMFPDHANCHDDLAKSFLVTFDTVGSDSAKLL